MLDLLHIEIAHRHRAFGNKRIKILKDRQPKVTCFSAAVPLAPNGAKIKATSLRHGTAISIICNPLKVLQGHNVFGTNSLRVLAPAIIARVLDHLNVAYTDDDVVAWVAGEFDVHAVDITHRYRLPENVTVFDIRRHMIRNMAIERYRPAALLQGIGVRFNAVSSYGAWLIYDKHKEMEDKRTHAYPVLAAVHGDQADDLWRLLTTTAKSSARVELKLEKKYLEQHGLNRGSAWATGTANEVYDRELAALRLERHKPMSVLRDSIASVTNKTHRRMLEFWSMGRDLKALFSRASLASHRKAIVDACGIDIESDVPAVEPLPMSELLGVSNRLDGVPKWVERYPQAYALVGVPRKPVRSSAAAPRKSRWDSGK
ncbi:phage/plasmid replication protein, gene II/X family [Burkholderia pseudomallei]|nr:phage/plasmid replication protein, gene II/X family [Burkholderia pseudomallei]CAJ4501939.1 phage/plasmid replication protein, gene II/X family [Burkholderia pseudomallei]CAJ4755077.1 phage/plasmid replication protein, gene II/X family [Burkholderia pseudomallei]CAJ4808841.1 phage/plasmid replication protein, gene II/X family [Burkholderia pseudomallei]CAJ4929967.1 phage/plasmid replication protein, gene II/X family [Burkholderia pseudomallei]